MRQRVTRALRLLLEASVAVAVTLAVLVALSHVFVPKNNQVEFGQHEARANGVRGELADTVDVLFLGDSEAYTSFSPLQLWGERGITSYVVGTSGQKLCLTRSLLDRALERQSPRVVVLETDCLFRAFSVGEAMACAVQDALPVFEYHDRWKSLRPEDVLGQVQSTWVDDAKGHVAREGVEPADDSAYMAPTDELAELLPMNHAYLEGIAQACERAGARLVLVSTPSTKNWNMARHNRTEQLASELGLDYVDLNVGKSRVDIDWSTDTYDAGDHLNVSGARKVTAAVGGLLSGRYGMPDHRGDDAYASWDEAYERSGQGA